MTHAQYAGPRTRHPRRVARLAILITTAALLGTSACAGGGGDSATGPSNEARVGLYALMHIDRKPIPTEVYHGPYFDEDQRHFYNQFIMTITGGELVLQTGKRFHLALDVTVDGDGNVGSSILTWDGAYEVQGNQVALLLDDGDGDVATIQGDYLSIGIDMLGKGTKKVYAFHYTR